MPLTLCQKWLTSFWKEVQNSNFTSMWFKYLANNVWRDFRLSMSASVMIKCPIGKSIFAVNLPLKLFRATVDNADIGSLKSLHTYLTKCLYRMLVKFEQNCVVQTTRHFELFEKKKKKKKKPCFFTTIFDKALMPFWKTFL